MASKIDKVQFVKSVRDDLGNLVSRKDLIKYFKENNYPEQIDFLQVDIDAGYTPEGRPKGSPYYSLHGLLAIPLNLYRFTLITFEHDANIECCKVIKTEKGFAKGELIHLNEI